jgi:hypothetical protein
MKKQFYVLIIALISFNLCYGMDTEQIDSIERLQNITITNSSLQTIRVFSCITSRTTSITSTDSSHGTLGERVYNWFFPTKTMSDSVRSIEREGCTLQPQEKGFLAIPISKHKFPQNTFTCRMGAWIMLYPSDYTVHNPTAPLAEAMLDENAAAYAITENGEKKLGITKL